MMPQYYQKILASKLDPKTFHFLQMVLAVLSTLRNVKLEALAHGVRMPIQANSRRKRLQRFLDLPCWDLESYVSRTETEPGRHYLRHSYFYMGSFGATWAQAGG